MKRIPISVFFFQRFQPYSYRKDPCYTLCCILITYPCTCCIFRLTLRILGLKDPGSICPEFHWEVGWSRKSVTHFDRGILYMISCYTYILQGPSIRGSSGSTGPNCVPFDQDHLWGHRGVVYPLSSINSEIWEVVSGKSILSSMYSMISLYNVYVSAIKLQLLTFILLIIITLLPILCNNRLQCEQQSCESSTRTQEREYASYMQAWRCLFPVPEYGLDCNVLSKN